MIAFASTTSNTWTYVNACSCKPRLPFIQGRTIPFNEPHQMGAFSIKQHKTPCLHTTKPQGISTTVVLWQATTQRVVFVRFGGHRYQATAMCVLPEGPPVAPTITVALYGFKGSSRFGCCRYASYSVFNNVLSN